MRTPRDTDQDWTMNLARRARAVILAVAALTLATVTSSASAQTITFENTVADLSSKDGKVRARAVELLKGEGYAEAALPLEPLILDPVDDIQMSAIASELNIFLAQKVTPKKRVGLIVEVRGNLSAEPVFTLGPSALGPRRVPLAVAVALANGALDRTFRVAFESLYAFGALAGEVARADRPVMIQRTGPLLAGLIGSPDLNMRIAALRVVGRVYAKRPGDGPVDERLGDAVISALNSREEPVRETAMWALGMMEYERAVEGLSSLLTFYRKGPLAERAFDALARISHEANMPQFVERLNGKDLTMRMIAIEGIARSNDRERNAAVQAGIVKDKHEAILLAAHFSNVRLADGSVTTIVEATDHEKLRDQALQYIYELAPGRAAVFSALIRPPAGEVRLDVIDALGLSGDAAAVAVVEPLATDKDPNVALAAQRALARLR